MKNVVDEHIQHQITWDYSIRITSYPSTTIDLSEDTELKASERQDGFFMSVQFNTLADAVKSFLKKTKIDSARARVIKLPTDDKDIKDIGMIVMYDDKFEAVGMFSKYDVEMKIKVKPILTPELDEALKEVQSS